MCIYIWIVMDYQTVFFFYYFGFGFGMASVNVCTYMANQNFHMALMSQLYIHH